MKIKYRYALLLLLMLPACMAATLRPGIKGVVMDSVTGKIISGAVITDKDSTIHYGVTGSDGLFKIPPVKERRLPIPADEPGRLAPGSEWIIIHKDGYENYTLNIYEKKYQPTIGWLAVDTLRLKPIQ